MRSRFPHLKIDAYNSRYQMK